MQMKLQGLLRDLPMYTSLDFKRVISVMLRRRDRQLFLRRRRRRGIVVVSLVGLLLVSGCKTSTAPSEQGNPVSG